MAELIKRWWENSTKVYAPKNILILIFLLFIFLYGVVIFNDWLTPWYHIGIGILFFLIGIQFLLDVKNNTYFRPVFTLRSLTIILPTTFLCAVLYMVPLVDVFLWMILLVVFLPFFIAFFVIIFSFPAEIFLDYLLQKALENLKGVHVLVIATTGKESKAVQNYLGALLVSQYNVIIVRRNGIVDILKVLGRLVTPSADIVIFELQGKDKHIIEKISAISKVDVLVVTSDFSITGKEFLPLLARKSLIISYMKNSLLHTLVKKKGKKLVLYGEQKTFFKQHVDVVNIGRKVLLGKEIIMLPKKATSEKISSILPAMYIARKLKIGKNRIAIVS